MCLCCVFKLIQCSSWEKTVDTITAQATFGTAGKPGAWSDMDVLTTGGQVCFWSLLVLG
jgi:hypothetical protein